MVLPGIFGLWQAAFGRFRANSIRAIGPGQPPAAFALSVRLPEIRFEDSIPRAQTGCTRAKMPPHYWSNFRPSMFAEWGLSKANYRRGAFRVENLTVETRAGARR
jgi:hypothetical protein